jgi:hypothetical protein
MARHKSTTRMVAVCGASLLAATALASCTSAPSGAAAPRPTWAPLRPRARTASSRPTLVAAVLAAAGTLLLRADDHLGHPVGH